MSLKEKIANLMDVLADEYDRRPAGTEVTAPTYEDSVEKFASSYKDATGEELDEALRARLAHDDELREVIATVASVRSSRPTPLGEATDHGAAPDENRGKSKEAAERAAYARFEQGILSIGQR